MMDMNTSKSFNSLDWWFEDNRNELEKYTDLLLGNDVDSAQDCYSKIEDSLLEHFRISPKIAHNIIHQGTLMIVKNKFNTEIQYELNL